MLIFRRIFVSHKLWRYLRYCEPKTGLHNWNKYNKTTEQNALNIFAFTQSISKWKHLSDRHDKLLAVAFEWAYLHNQVNARRGALNESSESDLGENPIGH